MRMQAHCSEGLGFCVSIGQLYSRVVRHGCTVHEAGMSGRRGQRWTIEVFCRGGLHGEAVGGPASVDHFGTWMPSNGRSKCRLTLLLPSIRRLGCREL